MTAPALALYAAAPAWLQLLVVVAIVGGVVLGSVMLYLVATWVFFGHWVRGVATLAAVGMLLVTRTVSVEETASWVQVRWADAFWVRLGVVVAAAWPVWVVCGAVVRRPRPLAATRSVPQPRLVPRQRTPGIPTADVAR